MIYLVTDTFPRQHARTQRFTLGVPRSFQISPDGGRVAFLRSRGGTDPVTCLWVLDVATAEERLVADPAELGTGGETDPEEKARRERFRERASGIVAFAADASLRTAAFGLDGRVFAADLTAGADGAPGPAGGVVRKDTAARVRELGTLTPAADPRPDPTGRLVAYVHAGALRVIDLAGGRDTAVAAPEETEDEVTFGLAEFVAAEEMGRHRGYWWAPDGTALLAARVDERPVRRWFIADPAHPDRPPAGVRYPVAGTPNADVSLVLARVGREPTPVAWDRAAFPYLVTACWDGVAPETPLIVVQTRDQREMRVLAVDLATGATTVVRTDTDPHWLEIVRGVPARTAGGQIVWTTDAGGARRLLVATAGDLAAGTAEPVTPATLQVREILSVDGDTVLFSASAAEPTEIGVWACHQGRLEQVSDGPGVFTGQRAGGTTVVTTRNLGSAGATVRVLRAGDGAPGGPEVTRITSLAERPLLPDPRPDIFAAGENGIRTALLLPSWHRPGSARLPVLMDPYGGPATQMVLASRATFLTAQWFAEQGFAVVVADGRGTPGRGPEWERTVAGNLARLAVEDQVEALRAAAARCADLDVGRVGIRGWSFGGYLAALAVVRRPDVFHAAVAGAPVTDWRMYDTHATERYLGHPDTDGDHYDASSVLDGAHQLSRPLLLVHGLADDNVAVAHSLRLSSVLLAAGRPHSVLPLSGITHMPTDEQVAENMLLLQLDFLRQALGVPAGQAGVGQDRAAPGTPAGPRAGTAR
jgi:dipeptidyl-peptidase-4